MDMNLKSAVIEDKKNHATGYSILWAWKKFSFLLCLDATTVDSNSNSTNSFTFLTTALCIQTYVM